MGSEFAQSQEWNSQKSLEWWLLEYPEHQGVLAAVSDLNRVYQSTPALWQLDDEPRGFEWINANDSEANIFSWLRWDESGSCVAVIVNMSPVPQENYRIALPFVGAWQELFNSDALAYGGSGLGNQGAVTALPNAWNGRPASADVVVPPLAAVYLHFDRTRT
jgi:1,4-alpha-glucan branching enzyme